MLSEAAVAVRSGVSAMHDVTEGGIFGALWEMAEASGVGLEIEFKKRFPFVRKQSRSVNFSESTHMN